MNEFDREDDVSGAHLSRVRRNGDMVAAKRNLFSDFNEAAKDSKVTLSENHTLYSHLLAILQFLSELFRPDQRKQLLKTLKKDLSGKKSDSLQALLLWIDKNAEQFDAGHQERLLSVVMALKNLTEAFKALEKHSTRKSSSFFASRQSTEAVESVDKNFLQSVKDALNKLWESALKKKEETVQDDVKNALETLSENLDVEDENDRFGEAHSSDGFYLKKTEQLRGLFEKLITAIRYANSDLVPQKRNGPDL